MESITIIANILLAILTGLYVALTYRLVNETRRATEQTRALFEKQFFLSTLPHLHISISYDGTFPVVTIFNAGDMAAYDVDLLFVGYYYQGDMDIPTFMVNHVVASNRNTILHADDEGFYGVYDHFIYPVFPQRKKVVARLDLPTPPSGITCLLQFRDLSGANYSQVYWFYDRENEKGRTFHLASIKPSIITSSPRVTFNFLRERRLIAENNNALPEHIIKEFAPTWEHSIPSGYTTVTSHDVEDRGEWQDI
jgi:hypothetical protein